MQYLVKITSTNPSIGAKERSATFSDPNDAQRQFREWMAWLVAELNPDMCDMLHTWQAENRETGYIVTMQAVPDEPKCKTCQDIDFDSKS